LLNVFGQNATVEYYYEARENDNKSGILCYIEDGPDSYNKERVKLYDESDPDQQVAGKKGEDESLAIDE